MTEVRAANDERLEAAVERQASRLGLAARSPHAVLALVAGASILCELAARESGSAAWMMLLAAIAAGGFLLVWRRQDQLRLIPLLGLTLVFQLAWIALHVRLGVTSLDSSELYRGWGNALLDGEYPESQYPPGAVLLFGLDALLGSGETRISHALVMVPFQLVTVAAVWSFRTYTAPWLVALVALWPMNAFFWEFRFDLVPTSLLAVGLLLAFRERWGLSGVLFGIGAAVKWTPALAFVLLAVWLLACGRRSALRSHVVGFALAFILLHAPFLLWSFDAATFSYRYFGDQGLTGESLWYLLLAPLGLATADLQEFWLPAEVPAWADPATVVVQSIVLLGLVLAAVRARASLASGVAIAAMAPVAFLLTNRVFSPQYLVPMLVAWAIAGAVVLESRREQLLLGLAVMSATTANAFVYPYTLYAQNLWRAASTGLFVVGLATSVWLLARAVRPRLESEAPAPT